MECPKCGQAAPAGAVECGACGVVFSRVRNRPTSPGDVWTPPPPRPPEPKRDSGNGILIVTFLFIAAMIGVAVWMKKSNTPLPPGVADSLEIIVMGVMAVLAVIVRMMMVRNARL